MLGVYLLDLESEMYQLSHLLIEQRNILSTMRDQNLIEDTKGVLMDEPANGKIYKKSISCDMKLIKQIDISFRC